MTYKYMVNKVTSYIGSCLFLQKFS